MPYWAKTFVNIFMRFAHCMTYFNLSKIVVVLYTHNNEKLSGQHETDKKLTGPQETFYWAACSPRATARRLHI